jgi:general secretion pathway protein M
MKSWFAALSPRDRKVLIGGMVALSVILLYFLAWEPLHKKVDDLRISQQQQRELVVWMRGAAREAQQLQAAAGRAARPAGGQSLLATIDATAQAGKLGESLSRVQPEPGGSARVWLDRVPFDQLVEWLEVLEQRHGIYVQTASIEPKPEPGLVDARLVLQGSAS